MWRPKLPVLLLSCFALSLALPAPAQYSGGSWREALRLDGLADENFGDSVGCAGDINADGIPDIIVGSWMASPGGISRAGTVEVYSGEDGRLLLTIHGSQTGEWFGRAVDGVGDVNGDGLGDLLISANGRNSASGFGQAGAAGLYSGSDGSLLLLVEGTEHTMRLGISAAAAGDIDADGVPDFIVGAPEHDVGGLSNVGSAFVYSGASGSVLWSWSGVAANDYFGSSVAAAGTVDAGGWPDLLVGAKQEDAGGLSGNGVVHVYSGFDGSEIHALAGPVMAMALGASVAGAGDVNLDGYDDVFAGAPGQSGYTSKHGAAVLFSGLDGSVLHHFLGTMDNRFMGTAVACPGDLDGDGSLDLVAGGPGDPVTQTSQGSLWVYSGADGRMIHYREGDPHSHLGWSLASMGDVDLDGRPDLLIGADGNTAWGNPTGSAILYGYDPYLVPSDWTVSAAAGCILGLQLDFPDEVAAGDYRVLLSATGVGPTVAAGLEVPLSLDDALVKTWFGDYGMFPYNAGLQGQLNAAGAGSATIGFPPAALLKSIGRTFYLAAVAGRPGYLPQSSSASVAIEITP